MKDETGFHYGFLESIEMDDRSLMEDFHESTKLTSAGPKEVIRRIGAFLHVGAVRHMVTRAWKVYDGYPRIELPPQELGDVSLKSVLQERRSMSNIASGFSGRSITLDQLATILGASYGITGRIEPRSADDPEQPLRAVASAGALYPCEIYVCALSVDNLEPGLYHYSVPDHQLHVLKDSDPSAELFACLSGKETWAAASVMLVIGVVIERSASKYMGRGYRFAMHDCGALVHNLYLTTTAVGAIGCANGGFYDQRLGDWLRMDNVNEFPAICFAIGY